jgi:hypothetical protein
MMTSLHQNRRRVNVGSVPSFPRDKSGYGYWVYFMMSTDCGVTWADDCPHGSKLWTSEEPELDYNTDGLFPSICVSKGEYGTPFVMIVCSALDRLDPTIYQVWMVRGNDINNPPEGGQGAGILPYSPGADLLRAVCTRDGIRVNARLASPGQADLVVFDAQGRAVRRLYQGWLDAGTRDFTWDCRHESGCPVAAGTYFIRLSTGGTTATARVSVIGR